MLTGVRIHLVLGVHGGDTYEVHMLMDDCTGWTRFMEWKYPVEFVVTKPGVFKGTGAVEAMAPI